MTHCAALIDQLRQLGYRITPQREMIIEALAHVGDHVTADEIFGVVKERSNAVNIATIYRTLDMLVAEGLVWRTGLLNGQTIYVTRHHGDHLHLVCRNCGRILAIDQQLTQPLVDLLRKEHHFAADVQHLSIVGLCIDCQNQNKMSVSDKEENEYVA
jgi:Fur family transcriptional regulator, ferric uptake regulator